MSLRIKRINVTENQLVLNHDLVSAEDVAHTLKYGTALIIK